MGVIIIPLITGLHIDPFIPFGGEGVRGSKEAVSICFACLIGLYGTYKGISVQSRNKWIYATLFYLVFSIWFFPPFEKIIGNENFAGMWTFEPLCYIFIYSLMILVISNISFDQSFLEKIYKTISIIGGVLGGYSIVQAMNADQFFQILPYDFIGLPDAPRVVGTIGTTSIFGAFLSICIPFAIYRKNWAGAILMVIGCILTNSHVAVFCAIFTPTIAYIASKRVGKAYMVGLILSIAVSIVSYGYAHKDKGFDNGRFVVWAQTVKDLFSGQTIRTVHDGMNEGEKLYFKMENSRKYCFTGIGLGSFRYIFNKRYQSNYLQAHNDYLEWMYDAGIFGLALLFMVLYTMIQGIDWGNANSVLIFTSFFSVLVISFFLFTFQVEPLRWYGVLFFSLLSNKGLTKNACCKG
jgi:hypothetical protein